MVAAPNFVLIVAVVSSPVFVPVLTAITASCASVTNLLFVESVIFDVVVVSELTTLPNPTIDLVIPVTVPVKAGFANGAMTVVSTDNTLGVDSNSPYPAATTCAALN